MTAAKSRRLKMDDLESPRPQRRRRSSSGEVESSSNTLSAANTPIGLPPPHIVNANRLSHTNPEVLPQRIHFSFYAIPPFSFCLFPPSLSVSPSGSSLLFLSRYLLTEVSFQGRQIGRAEGTCVNRPANDRCPSEAEGRTMLEEHPGVSASPLSSLFLFMWGQTSSLTSSLPFP